VSRPLPLPGTPGRGASDFREHRALDSVSTLPLSPALSPEYVGEGGRRSDALRLSGFIRSRLRRERLRYRRLRRGRRRRCELAEQQSGNGREHADHDDRDRQPPARCPRLLLRRVAHVVVSLRANRRAKKGCTARGAVQPGGGGKEACREAACASGEIPSVLTRHTTADFALSRCDRRLASPLTFALPPVLSSPVVARSCFGTMSKLFSPSLANSTPFEA